MRQAAAIYEQAVAFKPAQPGWGAGLIWVELAERFNESALPSGRTLQRGFQRAGVASRQRDKTPQPTLRRGSKPDEGWAGDAKEQIGLQAGRYASWLTLSDEGSGAV